MAELEQPAEKPNASDSESLSAEPEKPEKKDVKPPWEGEQFDAEKAWKLVQNLRRENGEKSARLKEVEDAKLTEQQKADRDLKETQNQIAQLRIDKAVAEARAQHPSLTDEDFELIGAGTPDEIADKAAKLAARINAQTASNAKYTNPLNNPLLAKPSGGNDPTKKSTDVDWLREAFANN